eukprot:NODE_25929_length_571_cov_1.596847.p1 GENE.NODE_25929_length_571_cov_1.596847~~NODE_25929_length_571_cov_1.596847.p1  ORF type:complete len:159 (-),score=28.73 NODE_25929_length_571_cov_1.596847:94-537(-)
MMIPGYSVVLRRQTLHTPSLNPGARLSCHLFCRVACSGLDSRLGEMPRRDDGGRRQARLVGSEVGLNSARTPRRRALPACFVRHLCTIPASPFAHESPRRWFQLYNVKTSQAAAGDGKICESDKKKKKKKKKKTSTYKHLTHPKKKK